MTVDASLSSRFLSVIMSAQSAAAVGLQTSATLCAGCERLLGTNARSRDGSNKILEVFINSFLRNIARLMTGLQCRLLKAGCCEGWTMNSISFENGRPPVIILPSFYGQRSDPSQNCTRTSAMEASIGCGHPV